MKRSGLTDLALACRASDALDTGNVQARVVARTAVLELVLKRKALVASVARVSERARIHPRGTQGEHGLCSPLHPLLRSGAGRKPARGLIHRFYVASGAIAAVCDLTRRVGSRPSRYQLKQGGRPGITTRSQKCVKAPSQLTAIEKKILKRSPDQEPPPGHYSQDRKCTTCRFHCS